ncbi:MAG: TIGR03435 family protein [Terracidiphilus sp.]
MASTLDPSFEVTTVKPHDPNVPGGGWQWRGARRFQATMPVSGMIQYVYGINKNQVINAPAWAFKDVYDYAGVPNMPGLPTEHQRINMMRKLLEERFNLKVHTEKRELASFVLSPAKAGSKLISSVLVNEPGCTISLRQGASGGLVLQARNTAMGDFIRFLHSIQDRPVIDQTGLTGQFDFDLTFVPDDSMFGGDMRLP